MVVLEMLKYIGVPTCIVWCPGLRSEEVVMGKSARNTHAHKVSSPSLKSEEVILNCLRLSVVGD